MKVGSYVFVLMAIVSLVCTACTREKKKDVIPQKENTLRLNAQADITTLHPHTGVEMLARAFEQALFEGLMRPGQNHQPEFGLAKSYEISNENTRYTFTLRPSKWSNGEDVTAHHFEKAWKWAVTPDAGSLRADLFYVIKNAKKIRSRGLPVDELGVKAVDDYTLVVDLEHPAPYFLELISNTFFYPLHTIDHKEPTVFNGPFLLDSYDRGVRILLKKNPLYWDAENVSLQKIESSFVLDVYTAMMMYEKGELDWIGTPFINLPLDILEQAQKLPGFTREPMSVTYWYACNKDRPLMNSVKIRRALSIVLNRKEICEKVLAGATPAKGIVPVALTLLKEEEFYQDNAIQEAQKLFDEGLKELQLTREILPAIELSHANLSEHRKLAELIQQVWEQAFDIKVTLVNSEWTAYSAKMMTRQFQVAGSRWYCIYDDPTHNLGIFKEPANRYNTSTWENDRYRELLDLADRECDTGMRSEYLRQAELLFLEEMPVIPIFSASAEYVLSDRVKGVVLSPIGFPDFKRIALIN